MARDGYIYQEGVSPNTRLLNPQRVRVFAVDDTGIGQLVGLIQTWNPSDTRAVEPVRGIGFGDQIAELAVGVTDLEASASIMMLYLKDIMQIFGYKAGASGIVRSLKHHQWPFDVKEAILIPNFISGGAGEGVASGYSEPSPGSNTIKSIVTIYEACWMSSYSKTFDIGATSVTQDMTCQITDVYAPGARIKSDQYGPIPSASSASI
jgi:hypothetical protein